MRKKMFWLVLAISMVASLLTFQSTLAQQDPGANQMPPPGMMQGGSGQGQNMRPWTQSDCGHLNDAYRYLNENNTGEAKKSLEQLMQACPGINK